MEPPHTDRETRQQRREAEQVAYDSSVLHRPEQTHDELDRHPDQDIEQEKHPIFPATRTSGKNRILLAPALKPIVHFTLSFLLSFTLDWPRSTLKRFAITKFIYKIHANTSFPWISPESVR